MAAYTNIDDPTIFFNTKLYTGNGSTQSITGVGFQPDWVWLKARSSAYSHQLFDSVRGATKLLTSEATDAEQTLSGVTSFDSDGFAVGSDAGTNNNTTTFVSWNWKAGTSFTNDASSTGVGSIDSSGSTSSDAGFSIISYTGTGSLGTIAHNLGAAPAWLIFKERSEARDWMVYQHKNTSEPASDYLYLNTNAATVDADNFMNDTAPTSSVFTVKGFSEVNKSSQTYICYAFAEKKGYSKFGSYQGNSSTDGPFLYMGFKPAFLMVKRTNTTENWYMKDNKRDPFNDMDASALYANGNAVEDTGGAWLTGDACANGFKIRKNDTSSNGSGSTYVYFAFAESPFVNSSGLPTNAR